MSTSSVVDDRFQSTPPRGRRRGQDGREDADQAVSIHASAREATAAGPGWSRGTTGFNPRLRAGGDSASAEMSAASRTVSIHASAREATSTEAHHAPRDLVSIHASAREATRRHRHRGHPHGCFNPRLRAGGDPARTTPSPGWASFNPRLRAGGDPSRSTRSAPAASFQSTPPRGRRRVVRPRGEPGERFQSTPPRGRRLPSCVVICRAKWCFNPRLRAGGDLPPSGSRVRRGGFNPRLRAGGDSNPVSATDGPRLVSIHASAREATPAHPRCAGSAGVSIHASAREATGDGLRRSCWYSRFNPRLRAGGDPILSAADLPSGVFQSTPPRGRRPGGLVARVRDAEVSIHASAREATRRSRR